jgi:hypothetical protein
MMHRGHHLVRVLHHNRVALRHSLVNVLRHTVAHDPRRRRHLNQW